jgi:hypothetical protein
LRYCCLLRQRAKPVLHPSRVDASQKRSARVEILHEPAACSARRLCHSTVLKFCANQLLAQRDCCLDSTNWQQWFVPPEKSDQMTVPINRNTVFRCPLEPHLLENCECAALHSCRRTQFLSRVIVSGVIAGQHHKGELFAASTSKLPRACFAACALHC